MLSLQITRAFGKHIDIMAAPAFNYNLILHQARAFRMPRALPGPINCISYQIAAHIETKLKLTSAKIKTTIIKNYINIVKISKYFENLDECSELGIDVEEM